MAEEIPEVGTVLAGQYHLTEIIGEGGMGVIYRARQESTGRDVAVKVLRSRYMKDESVVSRFENEARIISQLRHPNTLRLYDTQKTADGRFFIVTEFLQGRALDALLHDGPLGADRAIHIADQIAASLSEAHAVGIVHRDLKPANIFLDRVGGEDHVKVLDFGIAKLAQGAIVKTQANIILGTPGYMSPEQIKGSVADARSDIYALGVLIYQMLAGDPPFQAPTAVQLLMKQVDETPPPLDPALMVPPDLAKLVFKMMSKEPSQRPQQVSQVRERLRHIARAVVDDPNISQTLGTRAMAPEPLRRAAPQAASMKTMPYDDNDQVPTAAWERPLVAQTDALPMRADARPDTVTLPIEIEEPIELGLGPGAGPALEFNPKDSMELFLADQPSGVMAAADANDRATEARGFNAWILAGVAVATAAAVYFVSASASAPEVTESPAPRHAFEPAPAPNNANTNAAPVATNTAPTAVVNAPEVPKPPEPKKPVANATAPAQAAVRPATAAAKPLEKPATKVLARPTAAPPSAADDVDDAIDRATAKLLGASADTNEARDVAKDAALDRAMNAVEAQPKEEVKPKDDSVALDFNTPTSSTAP